MRHSPFALPLLAVLTVSCATKGDGAASGGSAAAGGGGAGGGLGLGGAGPAPAVERLFWTEGKALRAAKLDGTDVITVAAGQTPTGVAVDGENARVYWADNGSDTISSARFDGADPKILYASQDAFANPEAVAVDRFAKRLFWSETGKIMGAGLDGSGPTLIAMVGTTQGLALDRAAKLIYWTDDVSRAIHRANYDGSAAAIVYQAPSAQERPMALSVDVAAGRMFWTASAVLRSTDLKGAGVTDVLTGVFLTGVAVDPPVKQIVYTDNGKDTLNRSGYDGAKPQVLYTNADPFSNPRGAVTVFRSTFDEIK